MARLRTEGIYNSKKGKIRIALDMIEFKEGDTFILYSPALDLSGYGDSRKEARDSFVETLDAFIQYANEHETLERELQRLGWKIHKNDHKDFQAPDLSFLVQRNEQLKDIVNHQEFKKTVKKVAFA